ncbi:MAG: hypothetical protein KDA78_10420 [Planctomycetaceae bacterium]|nr:hypothetical protein [Planctomycetaceae bacterium]
MPILTWLFGNRKKLDMVLHLSGPGTFRYDIVGESHYQDNLNSICGGKTYDGHKMVVDARVIHEENNPHDKNAVRIDILGKAVGYLNRDDAKNYRKQIADTGHPGIDATCSAMIVGGWDRDNGDAGHYGVKLDLPINE